ncbi:MAG: penicillin-binding transpeptidase domain-containing protein [bacterium]|nr:penicillin-binding transpeptidase domain-containing protein [bacterium]
MSSWFKTRRVHEIAPDEIFLDSSNLPAHEASQFEGRVISALPRRSVFAVGIVFAIVGLAFMMRAFSLEVTHGPSYADVSRENTLERSIIFTTRGLLLDRNGKELAWNEAPLESSASNGAGATSSTFSLRKYTRLSGLAHILGFVQYPKADAKGNWWREETTGMSGGELAYDTMLKGANGSRMVERDARGEIQREDLMAPPENGRDLTLSIDAQVQSELYRLLSAHAANLGFKGGAAVIMDVQTGEILALTSFPEYDNQAITDGISSIVRAANTDPRTPLLNRAVSGLYVPGSIVKPIFAAAALNEGIITPEKQILSTGFISIPNPYDAAHPSIFRDWTVHGLVDMRVALAVSSDEYFYTIGGGYEGQRGLEIAKLDEYARKFGLAQPTGIALFGEAVGVIPTPEWKTQMFGPNDPWRIGDTYHTAIGQYGFQITPLQAVRYIAAIANGGKLLTPQLIARPAVGGAGSTPEWVSVGIPDQHLQVVREGMRLAVTSDRKDATVKFLNIPQIHIAAKTGTAQLGMRNEAVNSWSVGFWPAENPHWAYAVVLERAPAGTPSGAAQGLQPFFQWLVANHPEYVD